MVSYVLFSVLQAVTEVIEQRYIDRVIPDLGLVVTLYDIQGIEGGFIYPNDGAAFFKVCVRQSACCMAATDCFVVPAHK